MKIWSGDLQSTPVVLLYPVEMGSLEVSLSTFTAAAKHIRMHSMFPGVEDPIGELAVQLITNGDYCTYDGFVWTIISA